MRNESTVVLYRPFYWWQVWQEVFLSSIDSQSYYWRLFRRQHRWFSVSCQHRRWLVCRYNKVSKCSTAGINCAREETYIQTNRRKCPINKKIHCPIFLGPPSLLAASDWIRWQQVYDIHVRSTPLRHAFRHEIGLPDQTKHVASHMEEYQCWITSYCVCS